MQPNNYAAVIAQHLDTLARGGSPAIDACAALATLTVHLHGARGFEETDEAVRTGAVPLRAYYRHLGEVLLRRAG